MDIIQNVLLTSLCVLLTFPLEVNAQKASGYLREDLQASQYKVSDNLFIEKIRAMGFEPWNMFFVFGLFLAFSLLASFICHKLSKNKRSVNENLEVLQIGSENDGQTGRRNQSFHQLENNSRPIFLRCSTYVDYKRLG